jgi:hypothetical protein
MVTHKPKFKTTLASSGLLLPELSALISDSDKAVSYERLRFCVVDDNILSKPSTQSRQKIWTKLTDRYKFDFSDDLFQFWWNLIPRSEGHDLAQLAVLRWAQYDLLLRFLWNEVYLTRKSMEPSVQSVDIIDFIALIKGNHSGKRFFMERSENVRIRVAQHFLLILRECGAAKGKKNKKFVTLPVGTHASEYAGYLAKKELPGSHEILDHWALRWWGGNDAKADEILNRAQMNAEFRR